MAVSVKQKFRFGPFVLDVHSAELYKNSHKLKVQPQPIQVLTILLEHPGELVTRDELQKRIWPSDTFVDFEHGLNTAVKKLRQALSDESDTPKYVETLPRRGYRFVGEVNCNGPAYPTTNLDSRKLETPEQNPLTIPTNSRYKALLFAVAIFISLSAIVGFGYRIAFPPAPYIKSSDRLTHTAFQKITTIAALCSLATDGNRVYFQEHRGLDQWFFSQVSTSGGETSDLALPRWGRPCLYGISPSGSELLAVECCPNKFWSIPLPAGSPHPLNLPADAHWGTWMPDGRRVLYSRNDDKDMYTATIDGSIQTKLFSTLDITLPRVSPDGKRIRWTAAPLTTPGQTDIWEAEIDGTKAHPVFPEMKGQTIYGDWTSDGKLFFFFRVTGKYKTLWAVREPTRLSFFKSKPVQLYAGPLQIETPVAAKGSKELFVIGAELRGELSIYEPKSQNYSPYLGGISACYVTFSPDRQWIAFVSYPDGALWRSRLDGSDRMQLTFGPLAVVNPRWSPDGKLIVFMDLFGSGDRAIYIVSPEEGHPRLLLSGPSQPADPTWSPDSQSILYGEGHEFTPSRQVSVLDLRTMKSAKIPGSEDLWSPRWSPDGKYIVALSHERSTFRHRLVLFSFATKTWQPLPGGERMGWQAWSHDSRYVFAYDGATGNIIRIEIATAKVEVAASLAGVSWTNFGMRSGGWFDLTPDDQIMILRNRGSEDIYKLTLEY